MLNYQLTIRIPFEALDDPAARARARSLLDDLYGFDSENIDPNWKLQKIYEGWPPQKVEL